MTGTNNKWCSNRIFYFFLQAMRNGIYLFDYIRGSAKEAEFQSLLLRLVQQAHSKFCSTCLKPISPWHFQNLKPRFWETDLFLYPIHTYFSISYLYSYRLF